MPTGIEAAQPKAPPEAPLDCPLCPRLVDFRTSNAKAHPDWFNAPVASFGDASGRLLIVGLAPGLQGANRTGRPFTGDYAGDLLYSTMAKYGFSTGAYQSRPDDGLQLKDTLISNAVRCVPPENKPTGDEILTCRQFLISRIAALPNLKVMLALGRIAHDSAPCAPWAPNLPPRSSATAAATCSAARAAPWCSTTATTAAATTRTPAA